MVQCWTAARLVLVCGKTIRIRAKKASEQVLFAGYEVANIILVHSKQIQTAVDTSLATQTANVKVFH